jgi:hypothetical protein
MSKKFVVALHAAPHLRDPITKYLEGRGWRVWHWYADLWLLSEVPEELTAGTVHQAIEQSFPLVIASSLIVLEMGSELRYYGRAPVAEAWPWMKEYWGAPDIPTPIVPTPIDQTKQPISAPEGTKAEN